MHCARDCSDDVLPSFKLSDFQLLDFQSACIGPVTAATSYLELQSRFITNLHKPDTITTMDTIEGTIVTMDTTTTIDTKDTVTTMDTIMTMRYRCMH